MHIEPTVGRVVHLKDLANSDGQPRAAIITSLLGGKFIKVLDCSDICHREMLLVQEGDEPPLTGLFAVWMPFQKGQAQKTEELQKALAGPRPFPPNAPVMYPRTVMDRPDPAQTPPAFVGTLNEAVKDLKGPHITAEMVNDNIVYTAFYTTMTGMTTICELTLRNGFTVRGEASVMNPANFKLEVGQQLSYQDAWKKIWPLMAYSLADRLYGQGA